MTILRLEFTQRLFYDSTNQKISHQSIKIIVRDLTHQHTKYVPHLIETREKFIDTVINEIKESDLSVIHKALLSCSTETERDLTANKQIELIESAVSNARALAVLNKKTFLPYFNCLIA